MWLILCLNSSCFIVITVCYAIINILTRRSSTRSGSSQNPSIIRENRRIQNRITAIIATDFLCWVPFSIICALHNLKVIDATDWYVNFTMVLLPINSVINPLLYDNTLRESLVQKFLGIITLIADSRVAVYIRQMWQEREAARTEEQIEMEVVQTPATRPQGDVIEPAADNMSSQETPAC